MPMMLEPIAVAEHAAAARHGDAQVKETQRRVVIVHCAADQSLQHIAHRGMLPAESHPHPCGTRLRGRRTHSHRSSPLRVRGETCRWD